MKKDDLIARFDFYKPNGQSFWICVYHPLRRKGQNRWLPYFYEMKISETEYSQLKTKVDWLCLKNKIVEIGDFVDVENGI